MSLLNLFNKKTKEQTSPKTNEDTFCGKADGTARKKS